MSLLVFRILIHAGYDSCLGALGAEEEGGIIIDDDRAAAASVLQSVRQNEVKYDSSDYLSVYLQESNEHLRDVGDTFRRCVTALYLVQFLRLAHFFPNEDHYAKWGSFFLSSNEDLIQICTVIVRHIQACSCNAYEINELVVVEEFSGSRDSSRELGGAVFANVSLSNHSCFPNTMRYYVLLIVTFIYIPMKYLYRYTYIYIYTGCAKTFWTFQ